MIYDKDKLTKIQELARKILTNWEVRDRITNWVKASLRDANGSIIFELYVGQFSENTFTVQVVIDELSWTNHLGRFCGIEKEMANEEELIQFFKKVNNLTIDEINDELKKHLHEYLHQIL